ncbi:AAA family ATPase [Acanthopleuribacter pedis]|uniref:AAA family ATPase n=1 Tax=Acanthopleuribacter pedis TaxID=442870 RepID=A0A8J7U554_9BACT|nr:AAA family ATPase [Acanthopleuribacter pedis]MBO1320489.1 AAA family ATPase [Acanthopleuribacter pedis]
MTEALPTNKLLPPEVLAQAQSLTNQVLGELDRILLGQHDLHRLVLTAILARGHLLLEGMPGLGKTQLVKALGQVLALDFQRVQFTPDLMPSDILGAHILEEDAAGKRAMTFHPGPVFTHILLADEINRASPKTQSALLEAMQEGHVTLLGTTRTLPTPFFVLASQNPVDLEGTYPLPEAQLDRFLFKLNVRMPDVDVLTDIIATRRRGTPPQPKFQLSQHQMDQLGALIDHIFLPRPVSRYISTLVAASHPDHAQAPSLIRDYVAYGASPRAAIAIAEAARCHALLSGRPTVGFEDVVPVALSALNHRIIPNYQGRVEGIAGEPLVARYLAEMDPKKLTLPDGVSVARS